MYKLPKPLAYRKLYNKVSYVTKDESVFLSFDDISAPFELEVNARKSTILFVIAETLWHRPNNDGTEEFLTNLLHPFKGLTIEDKLLSFENIATKTEISVFLDQWKMNLNQVYTGTLVEIHKAFDKSLEDLGYVKPSKSLPEIPVVVAPPVSLENKKVDNECEHMLAMLDMTLKAKNAKPSKDFAELLRECVTQDLLQKKKEAELNKVAFSLRKKIVDKAMTLLGQDRYKDVPGLKELVDILDAALLAGEALPATEVPVEQVAPPVTPIAVTEEVVEEVAKPVPALTIARMALVREAAINRFFTPLQLKKLAVGPKDLFAQAMTEERVTQSFSAAQGKVHDAAELLAIMTIVSFKEDGLVVAALNKAGVWKNVEVTEKELMLDAEEAPPVTNLNQALQSVADYQAKRTA